MIQPAFYDHRISYEENYTKGPPVDFQNQLPPKRRIIKKDKFLGFDVNIPFGIPPGPLLNSKFIKSAFEWGYDINTYKTVRTQEFPSHPFPNVLFIDTQGELHPDKTPRLIGRKTTDKKITEYSITNSFGVPSKDPSIWQKDVKTALEYEGTGQLLILSFMGTVKENQTQQEFISDFAHAARLSAETEVKVIEANLSCPNIGDEGLVCFNLEVTEAVCSAIRNAIGDTPLVLKVGYYKEEHDLKKLCAIASKYAQGIAAINTLQVEVTDENNNPALPGKNRLKSGVCGASIKWAGVDMVQRIKKIKEQKKYSLAILGIGGVMTVSDYNMYREAGADCVQSATGVMWNPNLGYEVYMKEINYEH